MSNVLNYFDHPENGDKDNVAHFEGTIYIGATEFTAEKLENVLVSNDVTEYSTNSAIAISGIAMIAGGTGLAGMTLAALEPGCYCEIVLDSITTGNVKVTTASGVTYDGTNNTATFDAQNDSLRLGYKSATELKIIENNGVFLSSV